MCERFIIWICDHNGSSEKIVDTKVPWQIKRRKIREAVSMEVDNGIGDGPHTVPWVGFQSFWKYQSWYTCNDIPKRFSLFLLLLNSTSVRITNNPPLNNNCTCWTTSKIRDRCAWIVIPPITVIVESIINTMFNSVLKAKKTHWTNYAYKYLRKRLWFRTLNMAKQII